MLPFLRFHQKIQRITVHFNKKFHNMLTNYKLSILSLCEVDCFIFCKAQKTSFSGLKWEGFIHFIGVHVKKLGRNYSIFLSRRGKDLKLFAKIFTLSVGRWEGCGQLNSHEQFMCFLKCFVVIFIMHLRSI